ncbi:MAG TPA: hypothetical protein VHA35_05125 [Dongiaceae bacterium]|nr:hypothetical protein [Dongiaceae bacterium]
MPGLGPSTTIPSLDGPYRPNRLLDLGRRLAECPAPDNLVWQDDHLLFSSGKAVLLLDGLQDHGREAEEILRFESAVTAMAAAKDGSLAVGLAGEGIAIVGGEHDGRTVAAVPGAKNQAPTALCFADSHTLFAGMAAEGAGSLWRIDLRGAEPLCLADGLAAPSGLLLRDLDTLIVSEGGRSRLLECATVRARAPRVLLDGLPGFPARLARGSGNHVWLAIPALGRRADAGRSGGLVARLGAGFVVEATLHGSREGHSRGAASCLETRGELIVACRDDGVVIAVDLVHQSES